MKIVYFPGLNCALASERVSFFRTLCEVFTPEIANRSFDETKGALERFARDLIEKQDADELVLVGAGLGGYWVEQIGSLCEVKSVLINPSMRPVVTLGLPYPDLQPRRIFPRKILLAKDEAGLDYRIALQVYSAVASVTVYETGAESMLNAAEIYAQAVRIHNTMTG